AGTLVAALVASVGLLPIAPLLHLRAGGELHTLVELAMRPLGEWDLVLAGAGVHKWLLLASALPAPGLTMFGFASRRLRPVIGGIALGSAALMVQLAWSGDAAFVGGAMLARVWTIGNGLVCLWLARLSLDSKGRPVPRGY